MLVQVLVLRGRQVPSPLTKSLQPGRTQPDTIRINVENLPLSDNNGPTIALEGCEIQRLFRERLRFQMESLQIVKQVINCLIVKLYKTQRHQIGNYWALIFHNVLQMHGHFMHDCPNKYKIQIRRYSTVLIDKTTLTTL